MLDLTSPLSAKTALRLLSFHAVAIEKSVEELEGQLTAQQKLISNLQARVTALENSTLEETEIKALQARVTVNEGKLTRIFTWFDTNLFQGYLTDYYGTVRLFYSPSATNLGPPNRPAP